MPFCMKSSFVALSFFCAVQSVTIEYRDFVDPDSDFTQSFGGLTREEREQKIKSLLPLTIGHVPNRSMDCCENVAIEISGNTSRISIDIGNGIWTGSIQGDVSFGAYLTTQKSSCSILAGTGLVLREALCRLYGVKTLHGQDGAFIGEWPNDIRLTGIHIHTKGIPYYAQFGFVYPALKEYKREIAITIEMALNHASCTLRLKSWIQEICRELHLCMSDQVGALVRALYELFVIDQRKLGISLHNVIDNPEKYPKIRQYYEVLSFLSNLCIRNFGMHKECAQLVTRARL